MLDLHTFGNSKAEETLVQLLNEQQNPHLSGKVQKLLSNISKTAKQITFTDNQAREKLYILFRADAFHAVENSPLFSHYPIIQTYIKNSISIRLRKLLLRK